MDTCVEANGNGHEATDFSTMYIPGGTMAGGYENLEIFQLARELSLRIHQMTLALPGFEFHEVGSQIRRSSKSIPSNIVEGYCLRRHRNEYLQYLRRAFGSCEETRLHLSTLFQTGSLKDPDLYHQLAGQYNRLGKMLFRFLESVAADHIEPADAKRSVHDLDELP